MNYRFGFNGKEKDNELKGVGNSLDYGFRIYDSRLGKFLSVDPLFSEFPWNSSYAFAENSPIENIDLEGLEKYSVTTSPPDKSGVPYRVWTRTGAGDFGLDYGDGNFRTNRKTAEDIIIYSTDAARFEKGQGGPYYSSAIVTVQSSKPTSTTSVVTADDINEKTETPADNRKTDLDKMRKITTSDRTPKTNKTMPVKNPFTGEKRFFNGEDLIKWTEEKNKYAEACKTCRNPNDEGFNINEDRFKKKMKEIWDNGALQSGGTPVNSKTTGAERRAEKAHDKAEKAADKYMQEKQDARQKELKKANGG